MLGGWNIRSISWQFQNNNSIQERNLDVNVELSCEDNEECKNSNEPEHIDSSHKLHIGQETENSSQECGNTSDERKSHTPKETSDIDWSEWYRNTYLQGNIFSSRQNVHNIIISPRIFQLFCHQHEPANDCQEIVNPRIAKISECIVTDKAKFKSSHPDVFQSTITHWMFGFSFPFTTTDANLVSFLTSLLMVCHNYFFPNMIIRVFHELGQKRCSPVKDVREMYFESRISMPQNSGCFDSLVESHGQSHTDLSRLTSPPTVYPRPTIKYRASLGQTYANRLQREGRGILSTVVAILLLLTAAAMVTSSAAYELKPTTTVSTVTLSGVMAKLPCELPLPDDQPTLVLWYKDQATKPFYSYDIRDGVSGQHKVHDGSELGTRSKFTFQSLPRKLKDRLGYLQVDDVTLDDAGNYTCRVDFLTSQTMMSLLQLTVHERIRRIKVFDMIETPMNKAVVGPYEVGAMVELWCRAYGGYPTPEVHWMSRGEVLETSFSRHYSTSSEGTLGTNELIRVVSAMLHLPGLTREDNGREITCLASNTNLTKAISKSFTIDMYLPPMDVTIEGAENPLRAGEEVFLACQTWGARPPPKLVWEMAGTSTLTSFAAQSSEGQNVTTRRGRLLPTRHDNGRSLTCTATHSKVPDYRVAVSQTLLVHFAPEVVVSLAPALDPGNIKEGEDVYFECNITANPEQTKVVWLHDGKTLHTNLVQGVLAQGKNLVLQKVSRFSRGKYQCQVTNSVGTVTSKPADLDVLFAPECAKQQNVTISISPTEEVLLNCVLDSNPEEVKFTWRVNSSEGLTELNPSSYTSNGLRSSMVYRSKDYAHGPEGDLYPVVFCLATNRLGIQRLPCVFAMSPAGPPEVPVACTLENPSATSLEVTCIPDQNGSRPQVFVATVKESRTGTVVANLSSEVPVFAVSNLAPGRDYLVLVTAANDKGASQPYVLEGFPLKVAENKINNSSSAEPSSLLAVFVGVVSGFAFILTVLIAATRAECRRRRSHLDTNREKNTLGSEDEAPLSPSASLDRGSEDEERDRANTPESFTGPSDTVELTPQTPDSSTTCSSKTYTPIHAHQPPHATNPLPKPHPYPHSTSLPHLQLAQQTGRSLPYPPQPNVCENLPPPPPPQSYPNQTYSLPYSQFTLPPQHPQAHTPTQPLHPSIDLPHVTSNNHKYYTLKITRRRLDNESFV